MPHYRPKMHVPPESAIERQTSGPLARDLRGYLADNSDVVTTVNKPVSIRDVGALSAQCEGPIVFENIIEHPGFRVCDMLVKHRWSQARALGVPTQDYLPTLARRLRMPARGTRTVADGPVKAVKMLGSDIDWRKLPFTYHKNRDGNPYCTAMNVIRDPETGFYNSCHAGTQIIGANRGHVSFVTRDSNSIIRKYKERGDEWMPMAYVIGVPPAYEIAANYSGLHLDMWGEVDMIGTIMDQDIEVVRCETNDLLVPAHAEVIVEARVNLKSLQRVGEVTSPSMYYLPHYEDVPEVEVTAITMQSGRPIIRVHQTTPDTDHQTLPRLCHEAILFNRLSEMGLKVRDVRFPTWGAALSCLIQFDYPWQGFVNDALMMTMGAPWLNTKMVVALSADTDIDNPADVYHAIASRVDPARDIISVANTRGSLYDPSGSPVDGAYPFRLTGKLGIDATIKKRHNVADFERAWPMNWGKAILAEYLG